MTSFLTSLALLAGVQGGCLSEPYAHRVTGYVRSQHAVPGFTYDGTSVWSREPIVAANLRQYPIDSIVAIDGLGEFRVADTGLLGWGELDVLVDTVGEAYGLTGRRAACRVG